MAKLVLLVASANASVSTITALVAGRRSSVRTACRRSRKKPARQLDPAGESGGVQPAGRRDRGRSRWLIERAPIASACRQYHRRAGPSPRVWTITRNSSRRSPRMLSRHASSATESARMRSASAGGSTLMTAREARRGPARGWRTRRASPSTPSARPASARNSRRGLPPRSSVGSPMRERRQPFCLEPLERRVEGAARDGPSRPFFDQRADRHRIRISICRIASRIEYSNSPR